jgi:hypothetical protein
MLNAYNNHKSITEIKQSVVEKQNIFRKSFDNDYFWDRVKAMDSMSVLERLS